MEELLVSCLSVCVCVGGGGGGGKCIVKDTSVMLLM